jgi:hypothetical protein
MRQRIKTALAVVAVTMSLAGPVAAGPFEDGVAALQSRDYTTALRLSESPPVLLFVPFPPNDALNPIKTLPSLKSPV